MSETTIYLSTNLRHIRNHLGYSQADFANKLELNRNNYNHYEQGTSPKLETIVSISVKLRVTLDTLILDDWRKYSLFKMRQMLFPERVIAKIN